MIKRKQGKGKIYSGNTQLSCSIEIEQTDLMQLTVRAGTFIHTDGKELTMLEDSMFDFQSDPNYSTSVSMELGNVESIVDVWCGTCVMDGIEDFDIPNGWNIGHPLVFNFVIPSGCKDLTPIDIHVLSVVAGFPEGTTEKDWRTQIGGSG